MHATLFHWALSCGLFKSLPCIVLFFLITPTPEFIVSPWDDLPYQDLVACLQICGKGTIGHRCTYARVSVWMQLAKVRHRLLRRTVVTCSIELDVQLDINALSPVCVAALWKALAVAASGQRSEIIADRSNLCPHSCIVQGVIEESREGSFNG